MATGGGGVGPTSITIYSFNAQTPNHLSASITGNLKLGATVVTKVKRNRTIAASMTIGGTVTFRVSSSRTKIEKKTYLYKVYDEDNNFVGVWNDVIDEPNWTQEINSAGSTTTVFLARNSDSKILALESLQDSSGNDILDSYGDKIYTSSKSVNSIGPGSTVNHNYRVDIYAFYGDADGTNPDIGSPNGLLKFSGFISEINSNYGDSENTEVLLMSYGYDLDQYLVTRNNLAINSTFETNTVGWGPFQSTLSRDTTTFHSGTASLKITNTGAGAADARLVTPEWLKPNETYRVQCWVKGPTGNNFVLAFVSGAYYNQQSTPFTGNWQYINTTITTNGNGYQAMAFSVNAVSWWLDDVVVQGVTTPSVETTVPFLSVDPGAMIRTGLDQFKLDGAGETFTTYTNSTVQLTGTTVSYTYKVNSYKELLDIATKLAPAGWYYYVDLATNEVNFKPRSATPHHTFYLGKHIKTLKLKSYIGDVVNDIYFTGAQLNPFVKDDFEFIGIEDISARAGERGAIWTPAPYSSNNTWRRLPEGRIRPLLWTPANDNVWFASGKPTTDDYRVSMKYWIGTWVGNVGIVFRSNGTTATHYLARIAPDTNMVDLWKCINGTYTKLKEVPMAAKGAGSGATLAAEVKGNKITVLLDDTVMFTVVDYSIPTGKYTGLRGTTTYDVDDYAGLQVESFSLDTYDGTSSSLFKRFTRTPLPGTRRGMSKMSDNRVSLDSSATLLAEGELDEKSTIQYRSTVEILDINYDIETIKVGDVVAFRNFGNYVDGITMQIVGLSYTPDVVILQLDTVPPSVPKRLEDLKRALNAQENSDTPKTPL